jgi:hypothetical protein
VRLVNEIVLCRRREREGHDRVVQLDRRSSRCLLEVVPGPVDLGTVIVHGGIGPYLNFDTVPLELFQGRGRTGACPEQKRDTTRLSTGWDVDHDGGIERGKEHEGDVNGTGTTPDIRTFKVLK